MPDDAAKTHHDLLVKSRQVLMVRAMGYPMKKLIGMKVRPYTRVWLRMDKGDIESETAKVKPLGIVFQQWAEKYGGITFTQKGSDGSVIRTGVGRFANDRNGKEMGLIVDERWIWDDLIRQHKGLSHGNL